MLGFFETKDLSGLQKEVYGFYSMNQYRKKYTDQEIAEIIGISLDCYYQIIDEITSSKDALSD